MTKKPALMLRPGVPVLRRDADSLQVGLTPPGVVRLPDRPEVVALLDDLRRGRARGPYDDPAARSALDRLAGAGLAFPVATDPTGRRGRAALVQFGGDLVAREDRRRRHRLGLVAESPVRRLVADLCETTGLQVDDRQATVWLVVDAGVVPRQDIDALQRAGLPHLVLSGHGTGRRLGPFVSPGKTACLRCVDAHESADDPRLPFLLEQAARSAAPPTDPLLDQLTAAWAVRDLTRFAEGDRPSTWSATVDVGPVAAPDRVVWRRHPECGCAWDTLLELP